MPNAYDAVEMKTSREEVSADETVCVDDSFNSSSERETVGMLSCSVVPG